MGSFEVSSFHTAPIWLEVIYSLWEWCGSLMRDYPPTDCPPVKGFQDQVDNCLALEMNFWFQNRNVSFERGSSATLLSSSRMFREIPSLRGRERDVGAFGVGRFAPCCLCGRCFCVQKWLATGQKSGFSGAAFVACLPAIGIPESFRELDGGAEECHNQPSAFRVCAKSWLSGLLAS